MAADGVAQFTCVIKGKTKTMGYKDWAKESGISEVTLRRRVGKGMTMQQAIDEGLERKSWAKTITHDGKTMTIAGWAKHIGITESALRRRLTDRHRSPEGEAWSVARALTTPPKGTGELFDDPADKYNSHLGDKRIEHLFDKRDETHPDDNEDEFKRLLDQAFKNC